MSGRDAAQISTGEDNLIWRTALAVASDVGDMLPPIALEIDNDIPARQGTRIQRRRAHRGRRHCRSFARSCTGSRIAFWTKPPRSKGHPDNVAACVLGSIVASATDVGGAVRAVRVELPASYGVAVVVPDFVLPTSESRHVLPAELFQERTPCSTCSAARC